MAGKNDGPSVRAAVRSEDPLALAAESVARAEELLAAALAEASPSELRGLKIALALASSLSGELAGLVASRAPGSERRLARGRAEAS